MAGLLVYGWFEAGWVRMRILEVPVDGLPAELDGLRIAHLSDFHLGPPSRGSVAVRKAAAWVRERRPDLVVATGDLLSRPRGRARLDETLQGLDAFAVLGNHDIAVTRDPFSRPAELEGLPATLLLDESRIVERRGKRIQIARHGPAPGRGGTGRRRRRSAPGAPQPLSEAAAPGYHLVLAGHMHAGQIVLPFPGGKIRFAHLRAKLPEGLYRRGGVVLHVSPGLGTTFLPLRFFARPEVTELVLRSVA